LAGWVQSWFESILNEFAGHVVGFINRAPVQILSASAFTSQKKTRPETKGIRPTTLFSWVLKKICPGGKRKISFVDSALEGAMSGMHFITRNFWLCVVVLTDSLLSALDD
jgi:hypothetical protein